MADTKIIYCLVDESTIANLKKADFISVEQLISLSNFLTTESNTKYGLTAKQKENMKFRTDILNFMKVGQFYTVTDLLENVPSISACGMSFNRVNALVRQLKIDDKVIRTVFKGIAYFSLPTK